MGVCYLINLCPLLFASVFNSLSQISEACYISFVAWPMTRTGVDQSEFVNVGTQISY